MKMMDCVEVVVEKEEYARDGVHKGMQGWICLDDKSNGYWLVNFPQCGEKNDIAEISIKEQDLRLLPDGMDARINEEIKAKIEASEASKCSEGGSARSTCTANFRCYKMEESNMKEMDCVEVIVEKEKYAKDGIHKGMQGWICDPRNIDESWLVNFPQYGEKDDIAEISIKEQDLRLLPNGMDARINEEIKAKFEADGADLSVYMI